MASLYEKIRGTVETLFQIGLGGPQLKNSSGVMEVRNSTDAGYAVARFGTAVGNDDGVNKGFADANYSVAGVERVIRFAVGTATTDSTTSIPANSRITRSAFEVGTPYDNAATIQVGKAGGTVDLILLSSDVNSGVANIYAKNQDTSWGAGAAVVRATVGNAPTVGAGFCMVWYVELPNT